MSTAYADIDPPRAEIEAMEAPVVLEFGTPWCGYCRAAQPLLAEALEKYPEVRHLKIEDGKGRRLGRSFGVKLWPTLVFLRNGEEIERLVRPTDAAQIRGAIERID